MTTRAQLLVRTGVMVLCLFAASWASAAPSKFEKEVVFDEAERRLVKRIFIADKYMSDMVKAHSFLSSINQLLGSTAPGPAKLAFKWNAGAMNGWKSANQQLDAINKNETCNDLLLSIANNTPAEEFFQAMADARGCYED